ncbi:DNA alkylation repair protein [Candidatus Woesearchaeota archaeon]|nr:DNA alkylation repair protein [Candidatus Woesearchaeota archaeon]
MAEQFQLRDIFNKKGVENLGKRIKSNYSKFDKEGFVNRINSKLESLSFGDRSRLIQDALIEFLPNNFEELVKILLASLNDKLEKDDWGDYDCFIVVPQTYVIERLGMDNFEVSMNALYEMTMRCTSEGPIRRFIENYPEKSLKLLKKWTKDENAHVRRLVSEGTRPRLPLESPIRMFVKDPSPIIPLLEELKDDDELYVRRSVANNLNDISKDNPEVVVKTLKRWIKGASKDRMWLIRHSLRTLFKRGNKDALELMGYLKPDVSDVKLELSQESVNMGESFNFKVSFKSNIEQKLMIDYAVHYMKANGKTKDKVFKLRIVDAKKNEMLDYNKKHSFKEMTTRKHHKGKHLLEIIINGELFDKKEFELVC